MTFLRNYPKKGFSSRVFRPREKGPSFVPQPKKIAKRRETRREDRDKHVATLPERFKKLASSSCSPPPREGRLRSVRWSGEGSERSLGIGPPGWLVARKKYGRQPEWFGHQFGQQKVQEVFSWTGIHEWNGTGTGGNQREQPPTHPYRATLASLGHLQRAATNT